MENNSIPKEEKEEYSDFAINTADICINETHFSRSVDFKGWKKYSSTQGVDLEDIIQRILVKNAKPTVDHRIEHLEYLKDRYMKFLDGWMEDVPIFNLHYFVCAYDKVPLEEREIKNPSFDGTDYFYLFAYDIPFEITMRLVEEEKITRDEFDLLFSFSLRHCDLMKVSAFLTFHLHQNFNSDRILFTKYLKLIIRKFETELFTDGQVRTFEEWNQENEQSALTNTRKKIKTVLTVDQLAYFFKILVDHHLIHDNFNSSVITFGSENFESKERTDISAKSFDSKFYAPTANAIDFWIDQFDKLKHLAIRDKQKLHT